MADAAEVAAEVVEQIAGVVEKVSSEVAEKLPEESKLKDAVLLVEQVSKEAAEEAQAARDIIHKVILYLSNLRAKEFEIKSRKCAGE